MISVIVPVYNGEDYIGRCLDSVLNGAYRDLEVIVVVNGSTDGTAGLCRAAAERDERVRVIETDTRGVSHARNLGLDAARGAYIAFADADDTVSPFMLTHLERCMRETGCGICLGGYAEGTEPAYPFAETDGERQLFTPDAFLEKTYTGSDLDFVIVCNKLFDRRVIGDVRFNERLRVTEDRNFLVRTVCRAGTICRLDETLYYYWHGSGASASRNTDARLRMDQLYSLKDDIDFFRTACPDRPARQEYAACCLLQNADYRLRDAVKNDLDDIAAEVRPIVREAARMVRRARHIPKKVRFRLLLEHNSPGLYRLATRVLRR